MPDHGRRSPARILAPLALAVFALVFFAIVLGSGGGGGSSNKSAGGTGTEASRTSTTSTTKSTTTVRTGRATYTVKVGDTLGGIADKTGVKVETLLELNPDLDPQALVSGQKVKLK
jgi:LysM repeat protein